MDNSNIQYDPNKNISNLNKHGKTLVEVSEVLNDPKAVTKQVSSKKGKHGEDRWMTTGNIFQRLWSLIWCKRGEDVRLISGYKAGKKATRVYNNVNKVKK